MATTGRIGTILLLVAMFLTLVPSRLAAELGMQNDPSTDANASGQDSHDSDASALRTFEEDAAKFRLKRATMPDNPAADATAAARVVVIRDMLAHHRAADALSASEEAYRHGKYTPSGAALENCVLDAAAADHDISTVFDALVTLWLFHPEYDGIAGAMTTALEAAESTQDFTKKIDLDAQTPREVIAIRGDAENEPLEDRIFNFIATHGDRMSVAPRAALGSARALLLTSRAQSLLHDMDFIVKSRHAYREFLDQYPHSEFVFTAMCELALTYLVAYGGDQYDIGALDHASLVIDEAEQETHGIPQREALIQAYRRRIRIWHQQRDLEVARWYRDRKHPALLAWIRDPSGRSWDGAARFYYHEVIRTDPSSAEAQEARVEMARLPATPAGDFGASLLPPGTGAAASGNQGGH